MIIKTKNITQNVIIIDLKYRLKNKTVIKQNNCASTLDMKIWIN